MRTLKDETFHAPINAQYGDLLVIWKDEEVNVRSPNSCCYLQSKFISGHKLSEVNKLLMLVCRVTKHCR